MAASGKWPEPVRQGLQRSRGARFYRCAFQLNPFEYQGRHGRTTAFSDEASYNEAIVDECLALGVEVISIMDHYRVKTARELRAAAEAAGLIVFPGFEAVTKDGVHVLCLFEPGKTEAQLERILGDCGIHTEADDSPVGKYTAEEFFAQAQRWGAICIAAHVAASGGLLKTLTGAARPAAWKSSDLHACALPGPVSDAPDNLRRILQNTDAAYRRIRPMAVVNASHAGRPEDLRQPGTSCWIKMSDVSIEGLRQAFLDPTSRIRLASDPMRQEERVPRARRVAAALGYPT